MQEYKLSKAMVISEAKEQMLIFGATHMGSKDSALSLIKHASSLMANNEALSEPLRDYLAKALGDIANGERADKTLHINTNVGRTKKDNGLKIYAAIDHLANVLGWTKDDAFILVGELNYAGRESVVKAYYEIKPLADELKAGFINAGLTEPLYYQMMFLVSELPLKYELKL